MQDNRDDLYLNLRESGVGEDVIGTQQEFKAFLKDERRTRKLYQNLREEGVGEDVIGTEQDFYDFVKPDFEKAQATQQPQQEQKQPTAAEVRTAVQGGADIGVSLAKEAARQGSLSPTLSKGEGVAQTQYEQGQATTTQAAQQENNDASVALQTDEQDVKGTDEQAARQATDTQAYTYVPEQSNVRMGTPSEDALKKWPWLKRGEVVAWNTTTGEPFRAYTDRDGKALSMKEVALQNAKAEITGDESQKPIKTGAVLELPDVKSTAVRLRKGVLDAFVDEQFKKANNDDAEIDDNAKYKMEDGTVKTGLELKAEKAILKREVKQQYYDALNAEIKEARENMLDASGEDIMKLVDAMAGRWAGLMTHSEMFAALTNPDGLEEARTMRTIDQKKQLAETEREATAKNRAEAQANLEQARKEYDALPWYTRMLMNMKGAASPYGEPSSGYMQVYDTKNLMDDVIQNTEATLRSVTQAKKILATGEAYRNGEGVAARMLRGAADALSDTDLYNDGMGEEQKMAAVYKAVKANENGTATKEQKDLLDTYALLTAIQGQNKEALHGAYGATVTTANALPFMLRVYISPGKTIGTGAMKLATKFGMKAFGRTAMNGAMKRALIVSLKAGGRVTGDALQAAIPTAMFGAPAIAADTYDRLIGQVHSGRDEDGKTEYTGREKWEPSWGKAVAKAAGSTYFEYQSEMVGEYFSPLINMAGRGIGAAMGKIHLGKVRDFITGLSNKNMVREFNNFAKRTQWHGIIGEYAEEVVNNLQNAIFIKDMDFTTGEDGVFNLDTNVDTFLGVALMGGFMSALKTGDYMMNRGKYKTMLNDADTKGALAFGSEEWEKIADEIDDLDDKDAPHKLQKMINGAGTTAKKKAMAQYAVAVFANQGLEIGGLKNYVEELSIQAGKEERMAEYAKMQPVGTGEFGEIFDQFKGNASEAAEFLISRRGGVAQGVFNRKELGGIDTIFGNEKGGLYHMILKHVIENDDFDSVDDLMASVEDVIANGKLQNYGDNYVFTKDGYRAVVVKDEESGSYVLTAYDTTRKPQEKKRSGADATRLYQSIFGNGDGNLVPQNSASDGEGTTNSSTGQGNGGEMSQFVHEDGTIHKGSIYPDASEGKDAEPHDVFIVAGDLVMTADGRVDTAASSDMITYVGEDGVRHVAPAKRFESVAPPQPSPERGGRERTECFDGGERTDSSERDERIECFDGNERIECFDGNECIDGG